MSKNILPSFFAFIFLIAFYIALLKNNFSKNVFYAFSLCACTILPTVFPFFFISATLCSLTFTKKLEKLLSPFFNKIFHLSGASGIAVLISFISGYPFNIKLICKLKEKNLISCLEAQRASVISHVPSPVFCIVVVGKTLLKSAMLGILIYFICLLSCLIIGLVFCPKDKNFNNSFIHGNNLSNAFLDGTYGAVSSALMVGAFLSLFSLLIDMLEFYKILLPLKNLLFFVFKDQNISQSLCYGLIEYSRGISCLKTVTDNFFCLPIICFILSFGSLNVIAQSVSMLKKEKIKTARFIVLRILSAVLSFIVSLIIFSI